MACVTLLLHTDLRPHAMPLKLPWSLGTLIRNYFSLFIENWSLLKKQLCIGTFFQTKSLIFVFLTWPTQSHPPKQIKPSSASFQEKSLTSP
jgi:hypothetical protein